MLYTQVHIYTEPSKLFSKHAPYHIHV